MIFFYLRKSVLYTSWHFLSQWEKRVKRKSLHLTPYFASSDFSISNTPWLTSVESLSISSNQRLESSQISVNSVMRIWHFKSDFWSMLVKCEFESSYCSDSTFTCFSDAIYGHVSYSRKMSSESCEISVRQCWKEQAWF